LTEIVKTHLEHGHFKSYWGRPITYLGKCGNFKQVTPTIKLFHNNGNYQTKIHQLFRL